MDKRHTVFVLGAGASCEVNLPLGYELRQKICADLAFSVRDSYNGDVLQKALMLLDGEHKTYHGKAKDQARKIYRGLPLAISIDHYVNCHQDNQILVEVAKLAITNHILKRESVGLIKKSSGEKELAFFEIETTWYIRFASLLFEDCNWEALPGRLKLLSFIVFNYDRCFEHFLIYAIAAHYDRDLNESAKVVTENLHIFHPYGQVGKLPEFVQANEPAVPYGAELYAADLLRTAKNIRTFSERTDETSGELVETQSILSNCRRLVFLGFSYMLTNINLLIPVNAAERGNVEIFGTASGMSPSDVSVASEVLRKKFRLMPEEVNLKPQKCSELFKENLHSLRLSNMTYYDI
jgi:hypothetical protein